ncbi:MAG TPA: carbohydrate ABC transporter permease [Verrucomicrobiae bacterium]|nr:carbohydrate ABC transporter permease [Verrucomicrobiae bacterium]
MTRSTAIRQTGSLILKALIFLVLLGYLVVVVFPLLWLFYTSLKDDRAIFLSPFALPDFRHLQWHNFQRAWVGAHFSQYFFNSTLVTTTSLGVGLLLASMAAYALSRFRLPGGKLIFYLFLAGLMIPGQLAIIPLFFQMRSLGLLDSRFGLMLCYIAGSFPFAVFVLAAFFKTLPASLYEAAQIDGCSEWRAFWNIMLPLARPGLITVAIFQVLGFWNEFFTAFLFMSGANSEQIRTLPLGLANIAITSQYRSDWGTAFAGLVLVTVPTLIFYVLLQRHLLKGITLGALKG